MKLHTYNAARVFLPLCLAMLVAGCCGRQFAYRARVISNAAPPVIAGPPFPTPTPIMPEAQPVPVTPTPLPSMPLAPMPLQPAPLQPLPETSPPAALPATPQPSIIQPRTALGGSTGIVLEKVGPAQATVGALITYKIEVQAANAGARDVVVTDQITPGLGYTSSNPPAAMAGNQLEWRLGDLRGGELKTIEVSFRAEQAGVFNNCAVARTAEGQTSQDCASTAVLMPELEVRVAPVGPDTVSVGDNVTFQITVTNRSNLPATGLVISDRFDTGLTHEAAASPIEKELGQLAGGQSESIGVTFRVTQPGRLCNRVEVRSESGVRGAAEGCVTAVMSQLGPPPGAVAPPPATEPNEATTRGGVQVKVSGPVTTYQIDAVAEFFIDLTNNGEAPLTNVTVTATFDPGLKPTQATDEYTFEDGNLSWNFATLPAGRTRRLQVNCRCLKPAAKACTYVKVTTQEGATTAGEGCVEVVRGLSQLEAKVSSLTNPVAINSQVTVEIRLNNRGDGPDQNVAVLVVLPPELTFVQLGTFAPANRSTFRGEGQNVRFQPVAEIAAGETLTFRVRAKAVQAGEAKVEVKLRSEGIPQQQTVEHIITVTEE